MPDFSAYKGLIHRYFFHALLQGSNLILPLITIPHLVQVLGLSGFGHYSFLILVAYYASLLPDFGFTQAAPVEMKQMDTADQTRYVKHTLAFRQLLALAVVLLLFLMAIQVSEFSYFQCFTLALWVFGAAWNPTWLFQGARQIQWISVTNVVFKGIFALLVVFSVHGPADFDWLMFCFGITQFLAGLGSLWPLFRQYPGIFRQEFSLKSLMIFGKEHMPYFGYLLNNNVLAGGGGFILNHFHGLSSFGFYSSYEKLNRGILAIFGPVSAALYPFLNHHQSQNPERYNKNLIRIAGLVLAVFILLYALLNVFLQPVSLFLFSFYDNTSASIFLWFSAWSLLGIGNHFLGTQYLTITGRIRLYNRCYFIGNLIFILLCFLIIPEKGAVGLIQCMTFAEAFIGILMGYFALNTK